MALGLAQEIGSLEPGKAADIVAVRLDDIESMPLYDPVSQLVYATGRDKVAHVWVAGHHVLNERQLTTIDIEALRVKTREWNARIQDSKR
jgi:5-methylthioadenosine/S-adenosylhomocysteine deaminase